MGSLALLHSRVRILRNSLLRSSPGAKFAFVTLGFLWLVYLREMTAGLAAVYGQSANPAALATRNFALVFGVGTVYAVSHALQRLSRQEETLLLGALPISRAAQWLGVLWDVGVDAFGVFLLPLPFVVAYARIQPGMPVEKAAYGFAWVCVWGFVAALGVAGAVLLTRFVRMRSVSGFFRLISMGAALWLLVTLAENAQLARRRAELHNETAPSALRLLPTTWTAGILAEGAGWRLGAVGLMTVGMFAASCAVYVKAFSPEAVFASERSVRRRRAKPARLLPPLAALLLKEWRLIRRDSRLLLTWGAPTAWILIIGYLTTRGGFSSEVALPAMAGAGFLGATLVGLSSVGREGAAFEFLRAMLPDVRRFLLAKGIAVAVLTLPMLLFWTVDWEGGRIRWETAIYALGLTLAWSAFSVGVSARFPRFDAPNPLRAVRMTGILISYVYLFLVMGIILLPVLFDWDALTLGWMLGIPLAIALAIFAWGVRHLESLPK